MASSGFLHGSFPSCSLETTSDDSGRRYSYLETFLLFFSFLFFLVLFFFFLAIDEILEETGDWLVLSKKLTERIRYSRDWLSKDLLAAALCGEELRKLFLNVRRDYDWIVVGWVFCWLYFVNIFVFTLGFSKILIHKISYHLRSQYPDNVNRSWKLKYFTIRYFQKFIIACI